MENVLIGKVTIFWFRRDLRIEDNTALYNALKENKNVFPIFIFDTDILKKLSNPIDPRVTFIYNQIVRLKIELEKTGSSIKIYHGNPFDIFSEILNVYSVKSIYANHDYESYAIKRDQMIMDLAQSHGVQFLTYKDQLIFEKDEVIKDDGHPYQVFTPYMKKWKSLLTIQNIVEYKIETYLSNFIKTVPFPMPTLKDIGFIENEIGIVKFPTNIDLDLIRNYDKTRDIPSINGTSKLSIHLRFGTISIRKLVNLVKGLNEIFLNELIWREFYMMILWKFPHVEHHNFKRKYDQIKWINNESDFQKWCDGKTGFPFVDAGMKELNETGFMHNRLRMITASFLAKNLLIDWRWGESYFAQKLLDYELSSNNGGWQWAASTGADAVPYFRIFNPNTQMERFDPKHIYIKNWIPEYNQSTYMTPIVDLKFTAKRAIEKFKV